jgi:hypothetical protein
MITRILVISGVVLALFGLMVVPGFVTRGARRRAMAIHRIHPDDTWPWDLTDFRPVGWNEPDGATRKTVWGWGPRFRRVL